MVLLLIMSAVFAMMFHVQEGDKGRTQRAFLESLLCVEQPVAAARVFFGKWAGRSCEREGICFMMQPEEALLQHKFTYDE